MYFVAPLPLEYLKLKHTAGFVNTTFILKLLGEGAVGYTELV